MLNVIGAPVRGTVVIGKVTEVAPAGTVTVAGTEPIVGFWLDRFTTKPPVAAGPFSVIVPVVEVPPTTEFGEILTADTIGRTILTFAPLVPCPGKFP